MTETGTSQENSKKWERHDAPTDEEVRLQALLQGKEKLMALVGHDLRNAIQSTIALTNKIDKAAAQSDTDEVTRLSALIRSDSAHAGELLNDLLDWTRRAHESHPIKLETFEITELLQIETERLTGAASCKRQKIELDGDTSGSIRADYFMLSAVLRNLLSNAVKFSNEGATILVKVERKKGYWEFKVCDEGVGMTPELQSILLEVNSRKQKPGTAGETGSGLGLLLCEDFVQRHRGQLTWESAPGKGTTFSFTIPDLVG